MCKSIKGFFYLASIFIHVCISINFYVNLSHFFYLPFPRFLHPSLSVSINLSLNLSNIFSIYSSTFLNLCLSISFTCLNLCILLSSLISVCTSIYLSLKLSILYSLICLYIYKPISKSIYSSFLNLSLFIYQAVSKSIHPSIFLNLFHPIYISVSVNPSDSSPIFPSISSLISVTLYLSICP